MLSQGPAKKVTIYVGESARHRGEPLYFGLLNYLFYHGVSGATVSKGVAGFGAEHHMHTARILEMSGNLPVKIEFVERMDRLDELLPKLLELVGDEGLVEMQDTTILRTSDAAAAEDPDRRPARVALRGKATLMRIFVGEDDKWRGKSLHEAIVESLRAHDIAGATVYRGIAGYGAHRRYHKEKRLALSSDAPIMLSVIDDEAKIRAYLPTLEQLVQEGLVVLSDVDVIKYTHRLAPRAGAGEQP